MKKWIINSAQFKTICFYLIIALFSTVLLSSCTSISIKGPQSVSTCFCESYYRFEVPIRILHSTDNDCHRCAAHELLGREDLASKCKTGNFQIEWFDGYTESGLATYGVSCKLENCDIGQDCTWWGNILCPLLAVSGHRVLKLLSLIIN